MQMVNALFLIYLIPYVVAYFILAALYSLFFDKRLPVFHTKPMRSLIVIVLFGLIVFAVMSAATDPWLNNRIEHALGGGVFATLICFLAVRDTRPSLSRFQFFVFTALVVTSLGVLNELVEFFLQMHTTMIFSPDALDTWLDLTSNTVGIAAALAIFTPFVGKRGK